MDPNATVAEIESALDAHARGETTRKEVREYVGERREALREWRARGGYAPRGGWAAAGV